MAEALRLTQESGETNGIEDRTAADLLRRKGFGLLAYPRKLTKAAAS
jgi:hypothetical protein